MRSISSIAVWHQAPIRWPPTAFSIDDARHHLWEELIKRVMATLSPRGDPDARLA